MEKDYTIGIDAGGTKVAYGLFDGRGVMIDRMQHPTNAADDGPGFSDTVIENVKTILNKNNLAFDLLLGVGICMPSFILYDKGHILMTSAMTGIKDFHMLDYMQKRLPTRIVLDNDANGAALAEHRHGAGRGTRHMVYIVIGTGLGSGIIIDGKLFHGSYGWAGECGHMLATPGEGVMCGCENSGCYMSYTSGKFIPAHTGLGLDRGIQSALNAKTVDGFILGQAYKSGDALAVKIIEQMAHYLALCVYNIYQVLNIDTFVFGGGLAGLGDVLFGRVRTQFDQYNRLPMPVHFKMAELKKDFGVIGAAEFIKGDMV
ncbi:MAG: ROK family protein [Oscillospiraceae bacterium]|nr:ROK family protein [Oscillospiraceae bacterium]